MKSLKLFIATLIVLLGDKIALAQLDDACEVYEAFEEVETAPVASKSSKADDGGPRSDQRSLLIVFDATGSMAGDLAQLRAGAIEIVNELSEKENNPVFNYILSVFRDPDYEVPFVTTNPAELIAEINKIAVYGGGDCPELALHGLQNALDHALPNSLGFIFTDASAKDYDLYNEVAQAIQKKQARVYVLSTGYCGDRNSPEFKVLEKIARVSDGQLFNMDSSMIKDVLVAISFALDSDFETLKSLDFEEGGNSLSTLEVDESFTELMLSLSGVNVGLVLRDSSGETIASRPGSFVSPNIKIMNFEVSDTIYTIEASSSSAYSIRVGGISGLKFSFGFSTVATTDPDKTQVQPISGRKNILTIFTSNPSLVKCLTRTTLIAALETSTEISIPLKRISGDAFATELFDIPEEAFKIKISGTDSSGNVIDRIISTGIEADSSTPSVPCNLECTVDFDATLPHKKNCNSYYQCTQGVKYLKTCPSPLVFDVVSFTCNEPAASICFNSIPCVA